MNSKKPRNDKTSSPELSFYDYLYTEQFNYEEFKKNVFTRLTILRKLENGVFDSLALKNKEEDIITHFCLKLICAQSRWSIRWFVNLETSFFKRRCEQNIEESKIFFSKKVWPHLEIKEYLDSSTSYDLAYTNTKQLTDDIKFHFTACSDILAKRNRKIHGGFFQKADDVVISVMVDLFRKTLEKSMNGLYDKITIDSDERLIKLNKELFSAPDSTNEQISGDILKMSEAFPLCIKGIIGKLKTENHLKYTDRQVLCLFFKDIGMSLNETIGFFKSHFKCALDKFNKEYLYSIRHNYGLEGKRANYSSFPCSRIIGSSNEAGCFGCPFVNNHDFVKLNSDIEDLSRDAMKCCASVGAKIIGKEFERLQMSPAEYFKFVYKAIPTQKAE